MRRLFLSVVVGAVLADVCSLFAVGPAEAASGSGAKPGSMVSPSVVTAPRDVHDGRLPLSFIPNAGQFDPSLEFVGFVPGALVELNGGGVTYVLTRARAAGDESTIAPHRGAASPPTETLEVRATFLGASPSPAARGVSPAPHRNHFYRGADPRGWRTNVPSYKAVRYHDLYPGIDLEYHGSGRALEYDFHVAAGADPRRIRIRYRGIERLEVMDQGDLAITTRFGRMVEAAPAAYQVIDGERRPVRARFRLNGADRFGFEVEPFDRRAPLVIDPVLEFSTFLGGTSYDEVHDIAVDVAGNSFIVGGTLSPDFPATGTPVPSTHYSVYVAKIVPDGTALAYNVFLGGSEDQIGYGISLDLAGNAYIVGTTGSNDFPTTIGAYDPSFNGTNAGEVDMIVAKVSPSGALLYSTYLGGSTSDTGTRIAVDPAGLVLVVGNSGSSDYPTTAGAYDVSFNGGADVVLSRMNLAGAGAADLVYSTFLGGTDYEESHDLAVDGAGNAYIAGATRSADFPGSGGPPFNGTFDAFVAKVMPLGAGAADLAYASLRGGSGQDYGLAVAVNGNAEPYLAGVTASSNFQVLSGGFQTTYGGGAYDGFVTKFGNDGSSLFYSTFLGGPNSDRCEEMALDPSWNAVVTGSTESPTFPITGGTYDATYNGATDIFISALSAYGDALLESTFLGGTAADIPYGFAIDTGGRWYVTGTTQSADYPTTVTAFDTSYGGGAIDVVVTKFDVQGSGICEPCAAVPDTCCDKKPPLSGFELPSFSPNVLVSTREPLGAYPYSVTIFDLGSPLPVPLEDNEWASITRFNGPANSWNKDSLGTVFGLTLDRYGNIFVTHTSCFTFDALGQVFGGGAGAVYRIDGVTGAITTFCTLPNQPDAAVTPGENWPGLGNITYDCRHDQFFVTDLEDGRIYRIQANGVNGPTGTVLDSFDPLAPDDGLPGWAPHGERLWGVQVHAGRVYYAVWVDDNNSPQVGLEHEVRSVALLPSGAFDTGSDQHELFLPPFTIYDWSSPVSDISFSEDGKMLLAERSMFDETIPAAHISRVFEYTCAGGCWQIANSYAVGQLSPSNTGGGIDYDRHPYGGGAIGRVWSSGDALHLGPPYTDGIYGLQGLRPTGGTILNSILIDHDGDTVAREKGSMGDVEAPGCVDSTVGQVCGTKFQDLDHDGVKDGGEPGLFGWTIVLNGPGGPYTAVTNLQGLYCFEDLPPGNYTLGEVGQPGWVQTMPAGGSYAFAIAGGEALNGYDFGNYPAPVGTGCAMPPPGMDAWWPFDEATSATSAADVTHLVPAKNAAQLQAGAVFSSGHVGGALCIPGELDFAIVPYAQQSGLSFGAGSFAMDVWVNVSAGGGTPRMIVEKRVLISSSPYRTRGWALYLNDTQCFLEIGIGIATQTVPGPSVTGGAWTHVAVSIDRSSGQGRWYLDGAPAPAYDFVPLIGTVSSNADLYMGQQSPPFGFGALFDGCIDELEIFHAPLTAKTVQSLFAAGAAGKCAEYCRVPQITSICKDSTQVTVCFNICNSTASAQSYTWSLAGQPAGPGCDVMPTTFIPASGSVVVAPGTCSPSICVTVPRPAGLTAQNATACYAVTVVNDTTGNVHTCTGTIRADNGCLCVKPVTNDIVSVPGRLAAGVIGIPIDIGVINPCGFSTFLPYRVVAVYDTTDHSDPLLVSLDGLPPGEPIDGVLALDPFSSQVLTVLVSLPEGYDPAALYEIVIEGDAEGIGVYSPIAGTRIVSTYDPDETTDVPAAPNLIDSVRLQTSPNPFHGGSTIAFTLARADDVELSIYDLAGRRVRRLQSGRLAAGAHHFEWDGHDQRGRDLAGGVYFVRLRSERLELETKLVKLR